MLIPPPVLHDFADFEKYFDPENYLNHYFGEKRPDEFEKESTPFLVKTLNEAFSTISKDTELVYNDTLMIINVNYSF